MVNPFFKERTLRIVSIIITAVVLGLTLQRGQMHRSRERKLEQFCLLLEHLSAQLSAGHNLEMAFAESASSLKQRIGPRSLLVTALEQLATHLHVQMELSGALLEFQRHFVCEESTSVMLLLPSLRQSGGNLPLYIRQTHRTLARQLAMQREIRAEQGQKSAEAAIMAILPFGFAYAMQNSALSYTRSLDVVRWGEGAMLLTFILALSAVCITIHILTASKDRPKRKAAQKPKTPHTIWRKPAHAMESLYRKLLPDDLHVRLRLYAAEQNTDQNDPCLIYFSEKSRLFLLATLLSALLLLSGSASPVACILFPILICIAQDLKR